ncbi:MAG: hypothetical protein FJ271_33220 [Planctomycetes bacterium]|nr:hypothetical protein [Planctomycetota bacterium]
MLRQGLVRGHALAAGREVAVDLLQLPPQAVLGDAPGQVVDGMAQLVGDDGRLVGYREAVAVAYDPFGPAGFEVGRTFVFASGTA